MIFVKEMERLLTRVCGRSFELKKKEDDDEQSAFLQFSDTEKP